MIVRTQILFALLLSLARSAHAEAPQLTTPLPAPAAAHPSRVLTLEQALETARERQPLLRQARAGTLGAEARVDETRAPLLPQLAGTADG